MHIENKTRRTNMKQSCDFRIEKETEKAVYAEDIACDIDELLKEYE